MIRLVEGLDRPVHSRRKIVLEGFAPTPHGFVVAGMPLAVHAQDLVVGIAPEGSRFLAQHALCESRRIPLIAATPSPPVRALRIAEAVADQIQKTRRITLHQILDPRILGAQGTLAANVPIEPWIIDQRKIGTHEAAVEVVPRNSTPGGEVIPVPRMKARTGDIEQLGEVLTDPGPAVILVRNRVDAELRNESAQRLL